MVGLWSLLRRVAGATGAAILALGVCACSRAAQPAAAPPDVLSVSASTLQRTTLRDTITAAGTIVPIAAADFTVFAPQPSTVAALPVAEGQTVQAGDVLVRFDVQAYDDEVAARQNDVTLATLRLSSVKAAADRNQSLYSRGLIPRNLRDASQLAIATAQNDVASAQAMLDAAKRQQESATVKARFTGLVTNCWHTEGDIVGSRLDDPILRVVDPTRLQVVVTLSIAELAHIVPGQSAVITVPGAGPGVAAKVTIRPTPTDPAAKTAEVRLSFTDPTTLTMGTPVEAEILLDQRSNVLAVPREAILHDQDGSYVFVVGSDGRAHRTALRVGMVTRDLAEVVSGASAGDVVITSELDTLVDGMAVSVQ